MLEPLQWDSEFFGRKIAALTQVWTPAGVKADVAAAREQGYDYLISRPPVEDAAAIRALEHAGFYLTDLGVTWASGVAAYLDGADRGTAAAARHATEADIPWLQRTASRLFPLSRFYHDQSPVFHLLYRFGKLQVMGGTSLRDRCLANAGIFGMLGLAFVILGALGLVD